MTVIQAEGLTKKFGDLVAVNELSLQVEAGQIYGFLGPNGSGKSTTIRLLCGLLTPTAGKVRVLGYDIPAGADAVKSRIGYMTQKFSLYGDLSVAENLEFVARIYNLKASSRRGRVDELLKTYNLIDQKHQRVATLSGGQRQRVALSAAVLHRPDVLLLDEPTSAVDPKSRRDFWESLFDLAALGTTLLVSTHYMDEAERCHRLAILDKGCKVADDAPLKLMEALPYTVLEISTKNPEVLRHRLAVKATIASITQLGQRLRVLLDPSVQDPVAFVNAEIDSDATAQIDVVAPNLEDVFVAVTLPIVSS